jgi:hypothetical protein
MTDQPRTFSAEAAIPGEQLNYKGGIVIKPNIAQVLFLIGLFSLLAGAATGGGPFGSWIVYAAGYFVAGYLIYRFVPIPIFRREIRLDHQGITAYRRRFEWQDLIGTFIWTAQAHRGGTTELILLDRSGEISRISVVFSPVPIDMLATLIEYYRNPPGAA